MTRAARWMMIALVPAALAACGSDVTGPTEVLATHPTLTTIAHEDGSYFVGRGDVQLFFGWSNRELQTNAASVAFRLVSSSTTEWTCSRPHPTMDREAVIQRSTIYTTQGARTTQGRDISEGNNGPDTGFNVMPAGAPSVRVDGPAVGECPAEPSGFVSDGDAVTTIRNGLQIMLAPNGAWTNFP